MATIPGPSERMIPPWRTIPLWHEANEAVTVLLEQHADRIAEALPLARQIRACIHALDRSMTALCRSTCPVCPDPCCRRATVWFDFQDLIYLHMCGEPIPPTQIDRVRGAACPYLGPGGCTLARIQRPFICTWYICPEQTGLIRRQGANEGYELFRNLGVIKTNRRFLERILMDAVVDPAGGSCRKPKR